ncbi:unnamed protein product [Ixodes hexagonus]
MTPTTLSEESTNGQIEEEDEEEEGGIRIGDIYVPPPPPASCTFDPTGPRLMISRIENFNFKSYAGKRVIGPFDKNFTAIVGPNGSGKSNVIDSLLFVFGYRAQKIRTKKVGVLIHNSSKNTNLDSCSVHVYFQKIIDMDDNNFEVVPNSEFVVGRTAHRDNSSYYTVNGKRCTYKEANRVLRSFGIDLDHNRFLILQGEVEQIAMMKPKGQNEHDQGMLEFLEDIVGSSRYKEPIELLSQRIEKLTEERADKLNRVKLVEKDMEELQGARDEAIEFLRIENEITLIQNKLFQLYRHREKEAEKEALKDVDEAQQRLEEVERELKGREQGKQEQVAKVKKLVKECDKKEKELEGKKQEYSELEQKDLQCRETIKYTKANMKKLDKALAEEKNKMEELESQPAKFEKEIETLKAKKDKLEAEKLVAEEKLAEASISLWPPTMELQEEKAVHEQELLGLQKGVNETKSKYDIAQKELDLYVSTEKKETAKLHEIETNLEKVTGSLEEKSSALSRLERLVPEKEGQLHDLEAELDQVTKEEHDTQEKLRAERTKVEEQRSNAQANRSRSRVLDSLLQAKRSGELPGIVGRLGDLGAIDEKYDVAISTACGQLDYIVTDTVLSAQRSVEYLQKHDVGRANFIALEKMDRWISYTTKKITTPENVPRLFDLVTVKDQSILPAFYFALRDTLVAKDLEQATRIGLQGRTRHRVVTLHGELIDVSGTMSGGGGRVSRGKMGKALLDESISAEDLDSLVQQLGVIESKCRQLQERKGILEDKATALRKDVAASRLALQKFQVEVKGLKSQQSSLSAQLTEQRQKVQQAAPDSGHLAKLQKSAGAFKKDYEKTLATWKKVEDKVLQLHAKIMEITSSRMGTVQSKVDSITNQVDAATTAMTRASASIKTAERNLKKCRDKIASLEAEIVETKESSEAAKKEYKDLETQGQELTDVVRKLTDELKTMKQHLAEMTAEMDSGNAEENALKSKQIELNNKLELSKTALKECRGKVSRWNKEIKNLKLHEIDGEPLAELSEFSPEDAAAFDENDLSLKKAVEDDRHSNLKPNMAAIAEYRRKEEVFRQRAAELEEVTERRADQRKHHDNLRKERLNEFMKGFCIITAKLKETYQMLTLGGDAELELVDSLDPFSEGIVFSVRPPKKSWKNISNLSGGEKTLSSLALVFALHYYKPTPFYVMDEIDAALDIKNVSIVGHYVKERTRNAQFIIISLRNNMFELSDRLVGIFKVDNCTDSCTVNPRNLV